MLIGANGRFAKLRSTRSFTIAMCTVILLMLCSFSYAGPYNLMPDPSFESMTIGTTVTAPNCTNVGYLRFVNNYGGTSSTGKLEVITPAEDGNAAIKVSKTSASELVQVDLDVNPPESWMSVQGGHTYRVTFWARTDDPGAGLVLTHAGFHDWTHLDSQYPGWSLTSTWTMYSTEWTAPADANRLDLSFILNTPGSFIIDNVSVEDVAPAANLMPDSSFESLTTGTTVTAIGTTNVGNYIRFVNNYGSGSTTGKLEVVSQAEDGDKAIKLSKIANDSVWMDLGASASGSWIPVNGGHIYRITYWARTDDARSDIATIASGFGQSERFLGDTQFDWKRVIPNWQMYAEQWIAPEEATHLNLQFWIASPTGSIIVDNIHVEDVYPAVSSLTGTVTDMLSGAVIAGANVSITSGGTTTSTTTDANGVYALSNLTTGIYDMTVTAAGYSTANVPGVEAYGASIRNVSMAPPTGTAWSISDTFTRSADSDLGHTEDANAIPWVKTSGNTNSSINYDGMLELSQGTTTCGANLGRTFTPANFCLSVNMTWNEFMFSMWAGIAYRQAALGKTESGYLIKCPYDGQSIQLLYNGTVLATGVITPATDWQMATLGVSVIGNHHKILLNGDTVIDVYDDQKLSGGYIGLFCDQQNDFLWDNLNIYMNYGTISGTVSSGGAPLADATVSISGDVKYTTTTDSEGNYSAYVSEGTYTVTASKSGYSPAAVCLDASVTSGNTTDVDLKLRSNTISGVTVINPSGAYSSAAYALSGTTPVGQMTRTAEAVPETVMWNAGELTNLQPSHGSNLLTDPSNETLIPGTSVTADGITNIGNDWRFINVPGGSLEVISPGQDGNVAIRMTRTGSDVPRMDRSVIDWSVDCLIPAKEGHVYKETFWARSDSPDANLIIMASCFNDEVECIKPDQYFNVYPTSTWKQYTIQYVANPGTTYLNNWFIVQSYGSIEIDNVTVEDNVCDATCAYGADASEQGGSILVGHNDHAALWTNSAASFVDLNPNTASSSIINAVSNGWQAGMINVGADHASIWHGSVGSCVDLHVSGMNASGAKGLYTSDGVNILVGGYIKGSDSVEKARLWLYNANTHATTSTDLSSASTGASAIASVYGNNKAGYAQVNGVSHACLWTGTGNSWSDLNPSAASASAIAYMYGDYQVGSATVNGSDCAALWKGTAGSFVNLSSYLQAGVYGNSYARSVYISGSDVYVAGYAVNITTGQNEALLWVLHAAAQPVAMSALKTVSDGTSVTISDTVVATAGAGTFSDGSYYIEATNRANGIKATGFSSGVSTGSRITNLTGTIDTDENGERYINVTSLSAGSINPVGTLGMTNKSVVDPVVTGLLVRVWGEVKSIGGGFMTIDDGSAATFKVVLSGLTNPITKTIREGDHVAVTGLAGLADYAGSVVPVVRPRGNADIDLY
ncbi:MAG: carboxypeptidase regulatory-like domain-containing protein [Armatimonadota bacterium]|nr:carboxypeptidase regulatory-like domain-containing protein [bacterium]